MLKDSGDTWEACWLNLGRRVRGACTQGSCKEGEARARRMQGSWETQGSRMRSARVRQAKGKGVHI